MKNNQVYLDPNNLEDSMKQLQHFYRLNSQTLDMLRRVVQHYPHPIILYVDEANAPLYAQSLLDDQFTFNTSTGELVLFSADPMTFIDAIIEMWMFIKGFETMMSDEDYWKVELAIGCWKGIRDNIKERLHIPLNEGIQAIVGLPPAPDEAPLEDEYPFRTLVSQLDLISFTQMVRLAGRSQIRVNFPPETAPRVMEAYHLCRRLMKTVSLGLDIEDAAIFNHRLQQAIQSLIDTYRPGELPVPAGWQSQGDDRDAASGEANSPQQPDDEQENTTLLLGPPADEPDYGRLPSVTDSDSSEEQPEPSPEEVQRHLEEGPFAAFIDSLFEE